MKPIGDLQTWVLAELIEQFNNYIIEFFDEGLHEEGLRPVDITKFYENDFLGYAEEKGFAYLLSEKELKYSLKMTDISEARVSVGGLSMGIKLPPSLVRADMKEILEYVEKYYGDTILNIMNEQEVNP